MELKKISLSKAIKITIGNKILICSIVLLCIILGLTAYDFFTSISQLRPRINDKIKPLEYFTINQAIINNTDTINLKLESFNENNFGFQIKWNPTGVSSSNSIIWHPPFSWTYDYPLGEIAGDKYGYFRITGSFFSDVDLIKEFIFRFFLLIVFTTAIVVFLFPLAKKIPEKLFLDPINRFIDLISKTDSEIIKSSDTLPIELEELEEKIISLLNKIKEHERNKSLIAIGNLASQVAHDIRSPVSALEMVLSEVFSLPESKRAIMRHAIGRIRDIANNLLHHSHEKSDDHAISPCLLSSMMDAVVSEKRMQYRIKTDISIEYTPTSDSYGLFANINLIEIKRVLSNLINNAVEAIENTGEVIITLENESPYSLIKIKDTGPGIPQSVLDNLGKRGNTHGKTEGAGLGLSHAMETLKKCGGTLEIMTVSDNTVGTTILIKMPMTDPPAWFLKTIAIKANTQILILDDDITIHEVWDARLSHFDLASHGVTIHHFTNKDMLGDWLTNHLIKEKPLVFLCDYEIMDNAETGLDIIQLFELEPYSILVTGRYEESAIQKRCENMKLFLLPKPLSSSVPVLVTG